MCDSSSSFFHPNSDRSDDEENTPNDAEGGLFTGEERLTDDRGDEGREDMLATVAGVDGGEWNEEEAGEKTLGEKAKGW